MKITILDKCPTMTEEQAAAAQNIYLSIPRGGRVEVEGFPGPVPDADTLAKWISGWLDPSRQVRVLPGAEGLLTIEIEAG